MTKTAKSLAEIGQGSTKFAIAKILEKRDSVAQNAHSKINSAVGTWKAIAPKRSGFTAGNISVTRDKYASFDSVEIAGRKYIILDKRENGINGILFDIGSGGRK